MPELGDIEVARVGRRWEWRAYHPHLDDVVGAKWNYWGGSARSREAAVRSARRCVRRRCPPPPPDWEPVEWCGNVLPDPIEGEARNQSPLAIVAGNPNVFLPDFGVSVTEWVADP